MDECDFATQKRDLNGGRFWLANGVGGLFLAKSRPVTNSSALEYGLLRQQYISIMAAYLTLGIEVSIAMSLVAGIVVGSAMAIAGCGSIWVFWAEMLSLFVGGAIVLIIQSTLVIEATASLSLKAGLFVCAIFFFSEPVVGLTAVIIAIALAYFFARLTGKWKRSS